jgi:hypothetical protein
VLWEEEPQNSQEAEGGATECTLVPQWCRAVVQSV